MGYRFEINYVTSNRIIKQRTVKTLKVETLTKKPFNKLSDNFKNQP